MIGILSNKTKKLYIFSDFLSREIDIFLNYCENRPAEGISGRPGKPRSEDWL
jgi:hypothetical protein